MAGLVRLFVLEAETEMVTITITKTITIIAKIQYLGDFRNPWDSEFLAKVAARRIKSFIEVDSVSSYSLKGRVR